MLLAVKSVSFRDLLLDEMFRQGDRVNDGYGGVSCGKIGVSV